MKIAPSILDANFQNLQTEINSIQTTDRVHLDIMDGQFVPNLSFGLPALKDINFPIKTEAHLMVNNPENFFDTFQKLGCDTITFHIENTGIEKAKELLKNLQNRNINAGICVDGYTEIAFLDDEILNLADQILLMSVKAGFGGQNFMTSVLEKAKTLREKGFQKEIEVDGGVTLDNVELLKKSGVDVVVVGSFLMKKEIEERKRLIELFNAI